jgi:hypothetical protein
MNVMTFDVKGVPARRHCRWWWAAAWLSIAWTCPAQALSADAAALQAKHAEVRASLGSSPFQRPLLLQAAPGDDALKGDVYAVIDQPFNLTGPALQDPARWCDVLILHLNVKQCRARGGNGSHTIALLVGRKFEQPAGSGRAVDFGFRVLHTGPDYVRVQMAAEDAPADAKDQVLLEAVPLDDKRSFLRVTYSYAFSALERLGMHTYLSTLGRDKVGFTTTGTNAGGKPAYVGGVRGMVERNVMRYYLAVVTYVESLAVPPSERQEKRLRDWFAATERHALQLHEMGRDEYLSMKRNETRGMQ